jgi:hypothetical protein
MEQLFQFSLYVVPLHDLQALINNLLSHHHMCDVLYVCIVCMYVCMCPVYVLYFLYHCAKKYTSFLRVYFL